MKKIKFNDNQSEQALYVSVTEPQEKNLYSQSMAYEQTNTLKDRTVFLYMFHR